MKRIFKILLSHKVALFVLIVGVYLLFTNQNIVGVSLISCSVALFDTDEDEIKPKERDVIPTDSEGEE